MNYYVRDQQTSHCRVRIFKTAAGLAGLIFSSSLLPPVFPCHVLQTSQLHTLHPVSVAGLS